MQGWSRNRLPPDPTSFLYELVGRDLERRDAVAVEGCQEISEREPGDLGGFYEGPTDLANVYTSCYNLTMIRLPEPLTFAWDDGNQDKNALKHQVSNAEAEEAFFDPDKRSYPDPGHSHSEIRRILVGKTGRGRILLIVYTIRQDRIRVISARDLNKKREVDLYEEAP